ncbi:hypothetical protein F4553_007473 [Allocatelliglobosispora scoriae]|uniref:Integral membrane protein n=1 Tax=Allocatelliglobosispora scoriae TaxID=643052 RepID=A0A841C402_9ACTN|nr:hypothetical protein [Allocatelliglobosispora scoriae]MBB5874039.1 hypothetical protein [Allocatelliglobosispora scoriae]
MSEWFHRTIVDTGRLPIFAFFVGVVVGFAFIRFSVRMIRAQVRWWPGNVTPGGMHIHHVVFGVVFMVLGGIAGLALPFAQTGWRVAAAGLFGVGTALVLDEFALILHLRDVYWSEQGRTSIDAVFVAIAFSGMLVLGILPIGLDDFVLGNGARGVGRTIVAWLLTLTTLTLAAVTLLKGKIWTGLLGLFIPVLLFVGASRLARPHSPWARWRYRRPSARAQRKLRRAEIRDDRWHRPMVQAKKWFQDLIAGSHDAPPEH